MNYEGLTLSGFVKEIKEVSSGRHPRKFCFVLGAGASKSSGIKSGQDLVNIWEKDLLERNRGSYLEWKAQLGINEKNKYEFYSQYYEKRFKKAMDGYNYLENIMETAKPSIGYVMLSYILTHTRNNVVITTNFDHLIEDAINYYEHTIPLVIGHESLAHYITKQINRPMVIKIHRDLLLDPKNTESELNVLHDSWKKALDTVFSEYYPIFIGYAGNDHSLMDYLTRQSGAFSDENGIFPYWMLYKSDEMSGMVQEYLNKSEGYLIEHNGFDEVMYLLGDIFGYRLPDKKAFIRDAAERYEMLSGSIDSFTEALSRNRGINLEKNDGVGDGLSEPSEVEQAVQHITSQTESQSLFREAVDLVNREKGEEALEILRGLIGKNSQNARYHAWAGAALYRMKRYEEARQEIQKALESEPGNGEYHASLSLTLKEMGYHKEAAKELQKAIELEPGNVKYHVVLGSILHDMGNYERAKEEKKKAVELDAGNGKYHANLAETLHEMGEYEEELEHLQKAIELEPDNAEYYDKRGAALYEMKQVEEAYVEVLKALELDPENKEYQNDLGMALDGMGRYEEALKEVRKALDLDPAYGEAYATQGIILFHMDRYEEGFNALQTALKLEPGKAEYHAILGVAFHRTGRHKEAEKEKKKALELDPDIEKYIGF